MKTLKAAIAALSIAGIAAFASAQAQAELSQEEQLQQAQSAYEASAEAYEEEGAGWQEISDYTEAVRDTAFELLEVLTE